MRGFKCQACGSNRSPGKLKRTRCQTCRNARSRRRRQRKMHAQGVYTSEQAWDLYVQQRASCWYCGVHIPYHGADSHIDHIVPLSKGGLNSIGNLAWACAPCDNHKSDTLPWEWRSPLARWID